MLANRWPLLVVVLLGLLAGAWLTFARWNSTSPPKTSPGWTTAEEVVADFMRRTNQGDPAARDLLDPAPLFDDTPVSEAEAEARQAAFFLHDPKLRIEKIRNGELDRTGKLIRTGERYTLITKVNASTPPLRIRDSRGQIGSPSRLFMINPDIVVEIHQGKIRPIRPDLHRD